MKDSIGIGLMGLGVVGGGVARVLQEKAQALSQQVGCPLVVRRILVRQLAKKRSVSVASSLLTTNPREILDDPSVDIVVEVMGGESPALEYVQKALRQGKHLVTANKEVIAKHGPELIALAEEHGVEIRYEASVGGGIPLVFPLQHDLAANKLSGLHAIINGTTNYILSRMASEGVDFALALKKAQELGYAESDPTNDIEGIDAAYKLAILATLAFHSQVRPTDIYREGIAKLAARDFRYARELGFAIKLLAIAREKDGAIEARVHPVLVPDDSLLAQVNGVYNAVQVEGDLVGKVIFYGQGAGALPTTSAVVADLIAIGQNICRGVKARPGLKFDKAKFLIPMAQLRSRYYIRMNVADQAGVLAQISRVLGDNQISISSVIQKESDAQAQTAEIVIMTHPAPEAGMQKALKEMTGMAIVKEISNCIRVDG